MSIKAGSSAQKALFKIVAEGGSLSFEQVMDVVEPRHRDEEAFQKFVLQPLLERMHINVRERCILIATDKGIKYAWRWGKVALPEKPAQAVGSVAAPRTFATGRLLDAAKLRHGAPLRAGAQDYAAVPSRMGGQLRYPGGGV